MSRVVFTNGCFDVLHPGHVSLLERARALGTKLVVGINSDSSVRAIKGPDRPIFSAEDRKRLLLSLRPVDEVVMFEELTPERLIHHLKPDVLVKGGDWPIEQIVGAKYVLENGGEVHSLPLIEGYSSSTAITKMRTSQTTDKTDKTNIEASVFRRALTEHQSVFDDLAKSC